MQSTKRQECTRRHEPFHGRLISATCILTHRKLKGKSTHNKIRLPKKIGNLSSQDRTRQAKNQGRIQTRAHAVMGRHAREAWQEPLFPPLLPGTPQHRVKKAPLWPVFFDKGIQGVPNRWVEPSSEGVKCPQCFKTEAGKSRQEIQATIDHARNTKSANKVRV